MQTIDDFHPLVVSKAYFFPNHFVYKLCLHTKYLCRQTENLFRKMC